MGKAHEKDFFTPPCQERDRGKGGRKVKRKIEEKGRERAAVNRGEGRELKEGMVGGGKEGVGLNCAVRNADPFPRWPLWTISFLIAGSQDYNLPCLSLSFHPVLCQACYDDTVLVEIKCFFSFLFTDE